MVEALSTARFFSDERGFPQDLEVLRHRRSSQIEVARQVRDVPRSFSEVHEKVAANGVRERREDVDV